MKQVLQDLSGSHLSVRSVPAPLAAAGEVLIANRASLISAGTEKMLVDLARKPLLLKAKERPDQVRRVLEKVRQEGLLNVYQQVRQKLDESMPMGYSSAGVVLACGSGVQHLKPGDRVASNGPHAEIVSVPHLLCARVPDAVPFEHACFGVVGSIALQGVRLARCELGATVLVVGLGLVGQLTVGLLRAAGIRAVGVDPDPERCRLAAELGAELARPQLAASDVQQLTHGLGADAVIITASTKSNGPIQLAADTVRRKGRIVLVGVVGLELDRRPFYFKEAEFVVSCSYGPGRYDPEYEQRGHDYPASYVRWTEQRNIQTVLDLIGAGRLSIEPLISHRFALDEAAQAYALIDQGSEPFLGVVLTYADDPHDETVVAPRTPRPARRAPATGAVRCGVLGAGNFARMVLLPALRDEPGFEIGAICSGKGASAAHAAQGLPGAVATADEADLFEDPSLHSLFSITRHDLHARHVLRALEVGKHVFVEKPLCLTVDELQAIELALLAAGPEAPLLMVGFNRRFAPAAHAVRQHFADVTAPLTISIRFNAGAVPADHWIQHDDEGGGRLIGEACHAIDLATYLCGSPAVRVYAESIAVDQPGQIADDQCFITLRHANGSVSSVAYLAGGDRACPKERIEVFGGGRTAIVDDWRTTTLYRGGRATTLKTAQQKGHRQEIAAFAQAVRRGGPAPIPWDELRATTLASLLAVQSLREGIAFDL